MSHAQAPDENVLSQHREAMERGAQCTSCPLYGCKQGPVMPRLQERSMMLVVSESPSLSDVESGKPLQGHSGEVLNESLAAGNVSRADCSVTYAVLCRPPGGHVLDYAMTLRKAARKTAKANAAANGSVGGGKTKGQKAAPVPLPQDCCAPRLARDFAEVDTRVILTLGSESLKAAARTLKLPFGATKSPPGSIRVASLRKQLGAPVLAPTGQTLIATLHPAFVMGGMATFQHVMRQDIERAASLAQRGGRIHWHEPEAILKPSADTAVNVMEAMRQSGALITVDIETDGIDTMRCHVRCVGLGAILDGREVVAVIPLRHMSGLPWWSPAQEARVTNALTRLLEEAPLAGHNLSFDTAVLLNNVLMKNRNKCWMDTLIASKNTFRSELPHDLGFVSSRYFEAPHWKDDADAKSVSGVDDYWLHKYCSADVRSTMRLVPRLLERIDEDGTLNSFRTDTRLGPIVRDMGDLGLTLNEERRLTHFKTLDLVADARGKEVCRVVGDSSFNPNATHQVSKFLYITKGLSPPFTTDGIEWSEVNDDSELPIDTSDPDTIIEHASTDEAALLKLLDLGVDTETAAFIEALLAYRGLRKCCSTFLGYKWRDEDDGCGRILVDTFREKGFIREESWGPGLENLSVLHPSWRPVGAQSGRFTVKPNVQAWPERVVFDVEAYKSSDGKDGILNTRSIVVAPPGYVLVGADLAAVELRLYAMFSRDALLLDAIAKGKDPHALNYATMQSSRPADMARWYEKVMGSKPQVKKYLRNIAKRFCIAEGELVLVRRAGAVLEVPIEKVLGTDEVWDGVEWVTHDGVIFQGIKEVIFHDGLWATADHEVFLADGRTRTHGEAARGALRLARGSESGRPVRLVDSGEGSADAAGVETVRPGEVREVRTREGGILRQLASRFVEGLSRVLRSWRERAAPMARSAILAGEAAVREVVSFMLERLRRAWNSIQVRVDIGSSQVGTRECLAEEGVAARSDRQRRPLRAGEHSIRHSRGKHGQQEKVSTLWVSDVSRVCLSRGGLAISRVARAETGASRLDSSADNRRSAEAREASSEIDSRENRLVDEAARRRTRKTRVFDIVNAGPRRRFTASGIIVSNCFLIIYGGESETLFKTMAADRNPDGTRSFPDLKFSDVQMWTANWHRLHPETKAWHDAILRAWQQHGFVASLIDGRRRFFLGGIQDRNAILNAPVQSSTAAIANRALIAISEACPHRGWGPMAGPMLQVHDFIGIQVPVARQKEAEDLLIREIPYEHNGMRFDVEQKSGPSWDKT